MSEAVIVDTARSPIGRAYKGSLIDVRADDLAGFAINAVMEKVPDVDRSSVVDVMVGCALTHHEQGYNVARPASLLGGCFSPIVMAVTQTLARPAMRALAHAIWTMFFNLIGMGIGRALVGALSMQWQPSLGSDSLRYALLVVGIVVVPSSLCFAMAARTLRQDLAAARG